MEEKRRTETAGSPLHSRVIDFNVIKHTQSIGFKLKL
nr:MAG TPA: hypothetical protein [Caudoviricetes sp.]